MSKPNAELLRVDGLTAGYSQAPIISDIALLARTSEITAIVGPNGAGKSTLLKTIAGVLKPMSGTVQLKGTNVAGVAADRMVRHGMSYVPQVANVFPSLTVSENLDMGAYIRKSGVRERAAAMMEMFPDLHAARKRPARTLSGGQRTMLAIARALMLDPEILLLDEPTAGLSPKMEIAVWQRILQIRGSGVAILIVEQNTRRTLLHADHAYVLVEGRNRLEGSGSELSNDGVLAALYIGHAAASANQNGKIGRGEAI